MKIQKKLLIVLIIVLGIVGCNSNSGGLEATQVDLFRTQEEVTSDFRNLVVLPGVNDFSLESLERGVFWNFRVIAPTDATESNKRPLVMALHGGSGISSPTAHQNTSCWVEPGLTELNAFIISPNAGADEWYNVSNQNKVLALLDLAKTSWFVDANKVLVTGYSNGGNGSWFFADFYPQFFSASIAMASSYDPERADGSIPKIDIPLYVIHSNIDELFPIEITEGFVNKSINAGSTIKFVKVDGLSHYAPCDYVNHLKDAVNWVVNEVWL